MTVQERISVTSPTIMLPFGATNVPDGTGNAFAVEATSPDYVMPWAGDVIGISVRSNADYTNGILTFNPTIDGTGNTALGTTMSDLVQQNYASVVQGTIPFAAGARLGVAWTKSGTVAPTTTDVAITLWVILHSVIA